MSAVATVTDLSRVCADQVPLVRTFDRHLDMQTTSALSFGPSTLSCSFRQIQHPSLPRMSLPPLPASLPLVPQGRQRSSFCLAL
jgi:hypothetical protein